MRPRLAGGQAGAGDLALRGQGKAGRAGAGERPCGMPPPQAGVRRAAQASAMGNGVPLFTCSMAKREETFFSGAAAISRR